MRDEIKNKFKEIAKEAVECERVKVGEYLISKYLFEDWNHIIGMDLFDYIAIHNPENSDELEMQMVQLISDTLREKSLE